jgi:N-acetylglucosamine-6-phosphate deacetylase
LRSWGWTLPEVARMCATTPAEALGLRNSGSIAPGHAADLVVFDAGFRVVQTCVGGAPALEHNHGGFV